MANPVVVSLPENTVTIIATNVTAGYVHRLKSDLRYYQTYRLTGATAPTFDEMQTEKALMFGTESFETISSSAGIDVYALCLNDDGDNTDIGRVRVDI